MVIELVAQKKFFLLHCVNDLIVATRCFESSACLLFVLLMVAVLAEEVMLSMLV